MKLSKKGMEKCNRLGELTLQKDAIEAEIKELREDLDALFASGDTHDFAVGEQGFTLLKRPEDKAVMKNNVALFKILGKDNFIEIAKVSKTEIEKSFGKAVTADCVEGYETIEKLVLKKTR